LRRRQWRIATRFGLVVLATVAVVVTGYVAIRLVPNWLAQTANLSPSQQSSERGRVRTAALAFLGGTVAAAGALFAGLTFRLSKQGQSTDRFNKAIELLGHAERNVRLGGIYSLGQLARDDPQAHHRAVLEVLLAYIHDRSPWRPSTTASTEPRPATSDIQAAMTVLARRNTSYDPDPLEIDLSDTNLRGIRAPKIYLGSAVLSRTQLQDADLTGANLADAALIKTNLDRTLLERVDLGHASLQQARLVGTFLSTAQGLETVNLRGAIYDPLTTSWPPGFYPAAHGAEPDPEL
jgi:pentapeptide repeat protein